MSSLWGLVSTLSEGGRSLYATAAQDLADFSSSLKEDTTQLRQLLPPLPLPLSHHAPSTTDGATADDGKELHPLPSSDAPTQLGLPSSSSSFSSSSRSSLGLGLERLSGRVGQVLHLLPALPAVFGSEGGSGGGGPPPASLQPGPPPASTAEQRLLLTLRERSTFTADPVGSPSTSTAAADFADFQAAFHSSASSSTPSPYADSIALLSRHLSVQRWHADLVDSGEVDEEAFWCRALYAQHRIEVEEKRRQKLHHRLQTMQQQQQLSTAAAHSALRQSASTAQTEEELADDLDWEDEDEEAEQQQRGQQEHTQQQRQEEEEEEEGSDDREPSMEGADGEWMHSDASRRLQWAGLAAADSRGHSQPLRLVASSSPLSSAALLFEGLDDPSAGRALSASPEALSPSPSPASSEGSGELVDRRDIEEEEQREALHRLQPQQRPAPPTARTAQTADAPTPAPHDEAPHPLIAHQQSTSTPHLTTAPHRDRQEEDYDEWE